MTFWIWVLAVAAQHLLAYEASWQVSFTWHEDGSLDLFQAEPIAESKKSRISPAAQGGLSEVPVRLAWLDAADKVLMETDDAVDFVDPDGDGRNTRSEYIADTDPTSAVDFLRFTTTQMNAGQFQLSWPSRSTRICSLMSSGNLNSWTPGSVP